MDSEKSINSFKIQKNYSLPDYLLNNYSFTNLPKINVRHFFDTDNIFKIFVSFAKSTEIVIKSKF